jgi:hypothetical protein
LQGKKELGEGNKRIAANADFSAPELICSFSNKEIEKIANKIKKILECLYIKYEHMF